MTTQNLKIWIDADAAPRAVKDIVFRAAQRLKIETVLVANQPIAKPAAASMVRGVVVPAGANVADQYIIDHSEPGDIAITADIPLAASLVEKKVHVIDPHGDEFTPANIAGRLSMRNFMDELRGSVDIRGGAAPYNEKDKRAFANAFDRLLTNRVKRLRQQRPDQS